MNELQQLLGLDEEAGAYSRAHMLRRLAQLAIAHDRGISLAEIARRVGVSREWIRLYFAGAKTRKTAQNFEEKVEAALEAYSREHGITVPRVLGTPEERVIPDLITRDLMKAPAHGGHRRERREVALPEAI